MRRKLESAVADRASYSIAALADAGIGQSHHGESREAERDVDLDLHRAGVDTEDRCGPHAGEHDGLECKRQARGELAGIGSDEGLAVRNLPTLVVWRSADTAPGVPARARGSW